MADQSFAALLTRAALDPSADANTVSGLSSYVFTPGVYVTFSADGSARWTQPDASVPPPNLSVELRRRFFQVAERILMRPLPPSINTSTGRIGEYMVLRRLLPIFEQYEPDVAMSLRTRLADLATDPLTRAADDVPALRQGLPAESATDVLEKVQSRLDRARNSRERDQVCADAAVALAKLGDSRARDVAEKIEDADRRNEVRQYVDFSMVRFAIRKNNASEAIRLAKAGQLTHTQRAWVYTQAVRVLPVSQRERAGALLEDAVNETARVEADKPDRALLLLSITKLFFDVDEMRAWLLMGEVVRTANSTDKFTGEPVQITFPLATKSGISFITIGGQDFALNGVLRLFAVADLDRSVSVARGFQHKAPRAAAILAVARAVFEDSDKASRPLSIVSK